MANFNAGAIEAKLTLDRSSWTKDLKLTQAEIKKLEDAEIAVSAYIEMARFTADAERLRASIDSLNNSSVGISVYLRMFGMQAELQAEVERLQASAPSLDINVRIDTAQVINDLIALQAYIEALDGADLDVTLNTRSALQKITYLKSRIELIESMGDLDIFIDTEQALDDLAMIEAYLQSFEDRTVKVDVDTRSALRKITYLRSRIQMLSEMSANINIDMQTSSMTDDMATLEALLAGLQGQEWVIDVDANTTRAELKLVRLGLALDLLTANSADVRVDVDTDIARAKVAVLEAQLIAMSTGDYDVTVDVNRQMLDNFRQMAGGGIGGGGHLDFFRILIIAIIALLPILAVMMSTLTGAVVAFAAALVAALGPLLILAGGLVGLGVAFAEASAAGELTPEMEALADALDRLKDVWDTLMDSIAGPGFALMADGVNLLATILPALEPLFIATATAMSGVLDSIAAWVASPEFGEMMEFFTGFGVDMLVSFLTIGGNLIQFFGRLFDAIAPFASDMMSGLEDITGRWAEWARTLGDNPEFQEFLDTTREYGPKVLDFLGALMDALMAVGDALLPFAGPMLDGFTFFLEMIANAPTGVLTALIGLFGGLFLVTSVLIPIVSAIATSFGAVTAVLGAVTLPIVLIVAALALLGYAIYDLWTTNEEFRNNVMELWEALRAFLEPIITGIVEFFQEHWGTISAYAMEVFGALQSIISDAVVIITGVIQFGTALWQAIWNTFGEGIVNIIMGAVQVVASVFMGMVNTVRNVFGIVASLIQGDFRGAWENAKALVSNAVNTIKGIFTGIGTALQGAVQVVWSALGLMVGYFRDLGGRISSAVSGAWDSLTDGFRDVINGIIGWWNGLSFTVPSITIPNPMPGDNDWTIGGQTFGTPNIQPFAEGGIMMGPTLGLFAEAGEPEVALPLSRLNEFIVDQRQGAVDYGALAAAVASAVAAAVSNAMSRGTGLTMEMLQAILDNAGIRVDVDARREGDDAEDVANEIMFELRRAGFGGVRNA